MKFINCLCIIFTFTFIIQLHSQSNDTKINLFDENGKTPLIRAISNKNIKEAEALINKGAIVNLSEEKGLQGTPLMYATSTGNIELCQLLLNSDANINQLDVNKDHALNWATYYGFVDIMNLLIDKGADLNLKSKHGTAVDVAFRLWHHDSVAQPFKRTVIGKKLSSPEKELINAVSNNNVELVEKLLKKELSANTTDELGTPILQLAAQQGNYEMVKLLIKHKANLNMLNRVGQTPLAWSARYGHLSVAELLLHSGADANLIGNEYKLTPLIASAVNGNVSMSALLLESKANIDTKDVVNAGSALHWALWFNHKEVAKLLLHHDADYNYKALDNSYSAYDVAKLSKMDDVILIMDAITNSKNKLIGSWKVQEIQYQYSDTTYIANDEAYGRFIFSDTTYSLMYNPRMQKRTPFKNLSNPESDEIISAFNSIVFNTGTYQLNEKIITTTADIAKVPGFEGGKQFYTMNFSDDNLELVFYDETYPNGNKPEWYNKLKIMFILKEE